jgi:hypothetical protein
MELSAYVPGTRAIPLNLIFGLSGTTIFGGDAAGSREVALLLLIGRAVLARGGVSLDLQTFGCVRKGLAKR